MSKVKALISNDRPVIRIYGEDTDDDHIKTLRMKKLAISAARPKPFPARSRYVGRGLPQK